MKKTILTVNVLFLCIFLIALPPASATTVGTELLLLADVSGSLDGTDFALQRDGYETAFRDASVIDAIEASANGIAVSLVYWSTDQSVAVDWTHVYDDVTSHAFADLIAGAARPFSGSTRMANAMNYGVDYLNSNAFDGDRIVVDVSGDGADTTDGDPEAGEYEEPGALAVRAARDNLLNDAGVDMINALFIEDRHYFGVGAGHNIDAIIYGELNVIAGTGSFVDIAQEDYVNFSDVIKDKIYRELIPTVPEPTTMLLFGTGLIGLAGIRRRKTKK